MRFYYCGFIMINGLIYIVFFIWLCLLFEIGVGEVVMIGGVVEFMGIEM